MIFLHANAAMLEDMSVRFILSVCVRARKKDDETCCIAIWHVTKLQAKKKEFHVIDFVLTKG